MNTIYLTNHNLHNEVKLLYLFVYRPKLLFLNNHWDRMENQYINFGLKSVSKQSKLRKYKYQLISYENTSIQYQFSE